MAVGTRGILGNSQDICNQMLYRGQPYALALLVTRPGNYAFPHIAPLYAKRQDLVPLVLVFSETCSTGVRISQKPPGRLAITGEAKAADGSLVAIAVRGQTAGVARIIARRGHAANTIVSLRVAPVPKSECKGEEVCT